MGQIEDLRFFVQIVEAGGISKAASSLNIAKSALSRRLSLLEDRYESKLIERAPGVWTITQTGEELYQRAIRAVGEVDEIDADFMSLSADLSGPLSVSLPREFGLGYLTDALIKFKTSYPDIMLTIDFDDRHVDLSFENYDLAIRISPSEDESALDHLIGTAEHGLYASKIYLARHGSPSELKDLPAHQLLYFGNARRASWTFLDDRSKPQSIEFQPFLNSNSGTFLMEATIEGLGITRMPYFVVRQALDRGDLVPVLPDLRHPTWHIHLLYSQNRRLNRRMRAFADEITNACLTLKE